MTKDVVKVMHEQFKKLDPRQNLMLMEFSQEAGEFLEKTEKPTHLKVSEFRPYAELFRPNPAKWKIDLDYTAHLSQLAQHYFTRVVNPFFPVFIHDDRTGDIISAHDRFLNHVNSAGVSTPVLQRRETMEADSKAKNAGTNNAITRSFNDMLMANNTPEFMALVRQWKVESMVISTIQKKATPETSKLLNEAAAVNTASTVTTTVEEEDGDFL